MCSVVSRFFVIPWTAARQAPLSIEFLRQENWSGLSYHYHLRNEKKKKERKKIKSVPEHIRKMDLKKIFQNSP